MSCFYQARYTRRFPVSLLAVERFYELQEKTSIEEALYYTCLECCGREQPSEDDVSYLLERLVSLSKRREEKPPSTPQGPDKSRKTLGTKYHEFISSLPTDRTLLWMTGFDYDRAKHLYSSVDRDDVMQMITDFLSVNLEENRSAFEAALYGHGGAYKDDESSTDANTVDLTGSGPDGVKAALREAFGFK